MKKFSLLILAMSLAVGILAAPNVWATAYDPTGAPGNLPVPPPTPLIDNQGMIGDALLGEFYRAVISDEFFPGGSDVATYVSIENNSGRWVAAHIRLRSGRYSIETIDFPILLSPYDVFWFQFGTEVGPPQKVKIISTDKDTIEKSGIQNFTFPTADTTYDPVTGTLVMTLKNTLLKDYDWPSAVAAEYSDVNELTQGYIEVIGLFALAIPAAQVKAPLITAGGGGIMGSIWLDSRGCAINNAGSWASYYPDPADSTCYPALDVTKALSGHVFIGDFKTGLYTGYTMKALKDFRTGYNRAAKLPRDLAIRGVNNGGGKFINPATIIYNYSGDAAYSNPDWATSFGPTWNDGDDVLGGTPLPTETGSYSLDEVDNALFKFMYSSTFFNTGFSGSTYSMIALTFPTKYLHFFFEEWEDVVGRGGLASRKTIDPTEICCYAYGGALWNQAELPAFGPSPMIDGCLKYEVNFLGIGEASQEFFKDFCFLVDDADNIYTVNSTTWKAGLFWLRTGGATDGLDCGGSSRDPRRAYDTDNNRGVDPGYYDAAVLNSTTLLYYSDAAIASSARMLDFEDVNPATGSLYPHARAYDPAWDNIPTWGNPTGTPHANDRLPTGQTAFGYDGGVNK